jgi:hypothetical protein
MIASADRIRATWAATVTFANLPPVPHLSRPQPLVEVLCGSCEAARVCLKLQAVQNIILDDMNLA